MKEYKGIYGEGYYDNLGNLYLAFPELEGILVREKTGNRTYHVGIINEQNPISHVTLLENISLLQWKEFLKSLSSGGSERVNYETNISPFEAINKIDY